MQIPHLERKAVRKEWKELSARILAVASGEMDPDEHVSSEDLRKLSGRACSGFSPQAEFYTDQESILTSPTPILRTPPFCRKPRQPPRRLEGHRAQSEQGPRAARVQQVLRKRLRRRKRTLLLPILRMTPMC